MIKEKTVFVFGAGLSSDYKYPTNIQLRDKIADVLNWNENASKIPERIMILNQMGFHNEAIINFRIQLMNGNFETIDAFLEARKNPVYRKLGKAAIAMALIPYEQPNAFYGRTPANSFYNFLFSRMVGRTTQDTFHENPVSFITFNYDRSLEHFFDSTLSNHFENIRAMDVLSIMQKLKIIHVHGMLGGLPGSPVSSIRDYKSTLDLENVKIAGEGIVNFNEVDGNYVGYKEARKELHEARNVVFVGFGFHPLNLSRLAEEGCLQGKNKLLATSLGLTDDNIAKIITTTKAYVTTHAENAIHFAKNHLTWL